MPMTPFAHYMEDVTSVLPELIALGKKLEQDPDNALLRKMYVDLKGYVDGASRLANEAIGVTSTEPLNARVEDLKEAARAVCYYCREGEPIEKRKDGVYPPAFEHKIDMSHLKPGRYIWQPCVANPIHQLLAAAEQEQD